MGFEQLSSAPMTASDPIAEGADDIIGHVNADHTHHLIEYLRAFTHVQDATDARMTAVDRTGFDIEAKTPAGTVVERIPWSFTLELRHQVREEMVRLTQQAQAKLSI
jgi:putative heme iron utilization protein